MRRAERVPAGERGIPRRFADIREVVRLDEEMVKRGVERRHRLRVAFGGHPGKHTVPGGTGSRADRGEIPCGDFRPEILQRARFGLGGNREFGQKRAARGQIETQYEAPRFFTRIARGKIGPFADRAIEREREVIRALDPHPRAHGPDDRVVPFAADLATDDALRGILHGPVEDAVLKIDEKTRRIAALIGDPVDRRVFRRGDFHLRVVVVERDGVVAGFGGLGLLAVDAREIRARKIDAAR